MNQIERIREMEQRMERVEEASAVSKRIKKEDE